MTVRFRETVESSGFYTPEEWKYELEYLGYRKCDKCGKVNSTLVESVNYDELIYYIEKDKEELLRELSDRTDMDYSDKTFKKSNRIIQIEEKLQKIEEEIKMLETKEESPYYCDECEMDPHHIIQYSLF